jgi:uncharacterized protein (TIGR03083 family)
MTTVLDRDHIWAAIDAHRLRVADLLDQLTDEQLRQPSLCQGWTVRDVAAHLTLQQVGWGAGLAMILRYRGDVDRAIRESARERAAALPTGRIIEQIRGMVGSRRHNAGVTHRETLIDILVHGQDIAVPLGRDLHIPAASAVAAVTRMWTMRFPPPFPATRKMQGFRVVATDTEWSAGEGPEIRAPIGAILLVSCGRLVALPQFAGPGAAGLAVRLRGS